MGNRILLIEDDAAIAQTLKLNLECADYNVTGFDNGLSACDALAKDHDYDLALLDMMLPGMDGFALLPKLREWGIPVICLTAMADAQHEVQGLRGGAEDYIAKPFDMLALMVRMEKVLKRSGKLNEGLPLPGPDPGQGQPPPDQSRGRNLPAAPGIRCAGGAHEEQEPYRIPGPDLE